MGALIYMNLAQLKPMAKQLKTRAEHGAQCVHLPQKREQLALLQQEMEAPNFWDEPKKAQETSQKAAALAKVIEKWEGLMGETQAAQEMVDMLAEDDEAELAELAAECQRIDEQLKEAELDLLFSGEFDEGDAVLEISAGAGGTESSDFSAMLLRMYLRFAERMGFVAEMLEKTENPEAGIKSATLEIKGAQAYGLLRGEMGTHRLVRLSPFNALGKRQTSFAGVVITPLLPPADTADITIPEKDLRVDTFRASGAGGQHVNKTDSAVRMTHLPTGLVAVCQNQRSQHQNREKAMEILRAKLRLLAEQEAQEKSSQARGEVSEASWGTQIRSYVLHPYKMVKDLRTGQESGNPDAILDGDLLAFSRGFLSFSAKNREANNQK